MITLTARDEVRQTCLGPVTQIEIAAIERRPLTWREVWEVFAEAFPGRWAVQVFPPRAELVDGKNVYHLWVLGPGVEPAGLNLRV